VRYCRQRRISPIDKCSPLDLYQRRNRHPAPLRMPDNILHHRPVRTCRYQQRTGTKQVFSSYLQLRLTIQLVARWLSVPHQWHPAAATGLLADIALVIALCKNLQASACGCWMLRQARLVVCVASYVAIGIAGESGKANAQCKQEYCNLFHVAPCRYECWFIESLLAHRL